MLAIHQSAHIRALAAAGNDVTLVVQEKLDTERQAQGWKIPNFGLAKIVVDPDDAVIEALIQENPDESTHIFTTIRAYPVVKKAFLRCVPTAARMGLLVECQDFRGWKGFARLLRTSLDARVYGGRLSFILAMGGMGVRWFRRCGFPISKVFPYGYFVERPAFDPLPTAPSGPIRLMYLGQLIPRKGVDTLLEALGTLPSSDWTLTVLGSGSSKSQLEQLAGSLKIRDRITFLPVKSNAEAVAEIARHDLFLLPSRFDGWGAVVNEALMCGVPVVCSDNCGAAELLGESWRGEVFPTGSAAGLKDILQRWIALGRRTDAERERLKTWSRCIEGDRAAAYLLKVVSSTIHHEPAPLPPWREHSSEAAAVDTGLRRAESPL